eukprot:9198714-Alexandrium_andersonii.AAC.1
MRDEDARARRQLGGVSEMGEGSGARHSWEPAGPPLAQSTPVCHTPPLDAHLQDDLDSIVEAH